MKKIKINLFYIFSCLLILSCKQSVGGEIETPTIKSGTSKITGKVSSPNSFPDKNNYVNVAVLLPISGEIAVSKTLIEPSGQFSIDVNIETSTAFVAIYTSLNPRKPLLLKSTNGRVTNVDIAYNSQNSIEKIKITPFMSESDITLRLEILEKMDEYGLSNKPELLYNKSPNYFLDKVKASLLRKLEIVNNNPSISKELKGVLAKDFHLYYYSTFVFDYGKYMNLNYKNVTQDESKIPDIQKVDRSYYSFLKDFNLNDPQYLHCFEFVQFQKQILQNEVLKLPKIGENDISSWLNEIKAILSPLVGFENGQYYDILVANAYGHQLNEQVIPLSEKQTDNIKKYWKDGEIAKILLRKNHQVVEIAKFKLPLVVNDISSIPDDKVMEAIVNKQKGKVVFIDLWATWCAPCLDAMREFRPVKNSFFQKDVVFVYLTNGSSPKKLWEEKITGLGSEHYYLKPSQWKYVMDHFEFKYIPSYLLFDKKGLLIEKYTPFPGNDKLKEKISGLL